MASSNRDQGSSTEIIDEALRLVDTLQRRLLAAGLRRQVNNVTSPRSREEDVWAEAVKPEPEPEVPVADQVLAIARETLPEVGRHLSAAGALVFDAMSRSLSAVERSLRYRPGGESSGSPSETGR
ncbi:hypothetical protein [Thermobifida cellulosilytica]|nr:hypothetical protein [Thermobifida cellulosilytica]